MISLNSLKNTSRPKRPRKRVGRGVGSKLGKTCGRGEKGAGSRAGYKRRLGKEGGQFPIFMKTPIRGFSNAPFRVTLHTINLGQIENLFEAGETVNVKTLKEKRFITGTCCGLKILGNGELKKKVKIEANAISESARAKLQESKISVKLIGQEE
jgi:large subunit ribosomal protein L15